MDPNQNTSQPPNQQPHQPPANQQTPPQQPPNQSNPKKSKLMIIIVAVVIFVLLAVSGVAGYFIATNNNSETNTEEELVKDTITTPAPEPRADWQTFSNEEFSIKYPTNYTERLGWGSAHSDGTTSDTFQFWEVGTTPSEREGTGVYYTVRIRDNIGNITLEDWANAKWIGAIYAPMMEEHLIEAIENHKSIEINGNEAILLDHAEETNFYVVVKGDRKVAVLGCIQYSYEISEICDDAFSTFEFTDLNDTSNWKTYTNSQYGYEIKYPPNWTVFEATQTGVEPEGDTNLQPLSDTNTVHAISIESEKPRELMGAGVSIEPNSSNLSLQEFAVEYTGNNTRETNPAQINENANFAGEPATEITWYCCSYPMPKTFLVLKDGYFYSISIPDLGDVDGEELKAAGYDEQYYKAPKINEQILSSFKFIE